MLDVKKIVFFNFWRNGDCFINRNYVKDIIVRYSTLDVEFVYAHNNHRSILEDINCKQIATSELPSGIGTFMKFAIDRENSILYINTWVGAYVGEFFPDKEHANYGILNRIWNQIYSTLKISFDKPIQDFYPTVDYQSFDLSSAKQYIDSIGEKQLVLFCNGQQQSEQSDMGNMHEIISTIANNNKNVEFLVCNQLDLDANNITYTDDLFNAPVGNLMQISFLSLHANLIIGKNSGPFTFAHTKENLNNYKKTFLCFSKSLTSTLLGEGEYMCNSLFSDTVDDSIATSIIDQIIHGVPYYNEVKPTIKL